MYTDLTAQLMRERSLTFPLLLCLKTCGYDRYSVFWTFLPCNSILQPTGAIQAITQELTQFWNHFSCKSTCLCGIINSAKLANTAMTSCFSVWAGLFKYYTIVCSIDTLWDLTSSNSDYNIMTRWLFSHDNVSLSLKNISYSKRKTLFRLIFTPT